MLQHGGTVGLKMLAEADRRRWRKARDNALQQIFPIEQRRFGEVGALAQKKIDHKAPEPVPPAGLQVRLQIVEVGNAGVVLDDDLAIDQRGAETKLGERIRDAAKAHRPVKCLSCEQT